MRMSLALALPAALAATMPMMALAEPPQRQITVIGSAEVEALPDLARISAGVQTDGETAAQALSENSTAMTQVFAVLEGAGIARADIQTNQLSLDPVWQQPGENQAAAPRIVGYQANNMVTVLLRDISKLGSVVDALGGAGANRIFGVGFEVGNPRPFLDQARTKAVGEARDKAELMSKAAGVTLGPVLTIRETPNMGMPGPLRAKADMAMAAPVSGGTVAMGVDVEVVYGLE